MPWMLPAAILGSTVFSGVLGAATGPNYPNPTYGGAGGGQPYFYQPTGQPGADTQLQGFFNNYQNPYSKYGPQFDAYLQSVQNNPYQAGYQGGAGTAGGLYGSAGNYATGAGQGLYGYGTYGLDTLSQLGGAARGGNPYLAGMVSDSSAAGASLQSAGSYGLDTLQGLAGAAHGGNPYSAGMVSGAGAAGQALGGVGTQAISDASRLGAMASSYAQPLSSFATSGATNLNDLAQSTTSGLLPYGQQIASTLPSLAGQYTAPGNAAASQILSTAFDPQGALYGQQFQQNLDQTRAGLAARGIDTSGAGQGIEMKSIQDFNTNWQNNQLGRQSQGLSAYDASAASNYGLQSSGYSQGLNSLLSASTGTFNPYATAYTAGVGGLNSAASTGYGIQSGAATTAQQLGAAGAGNIATGAAMPYNAQQQSITDQVGLLGQIGQAQGTYGNIYTSGIGLPYNAQQKGITDQASLVGQIGQAGSTYGNISAQGGNQLTLGANNAYQAGATPYNAYNTIQGNQYQGLMNAYSPYAQSTQFDNQMQGNLMQYMGLGPNAAQGAFNAGAGAWGANNYNMGQIGNLGGAAAYGYGSANPYPGGPTSFGNMFGSSPYMPISQPNFYVPSAGYNSGTPLAPFTPYTG